MKKTILAAALMLTVGFGATAVNAEQPSDDWNANWGFEGFSDKRDQAALIEFMKGGGFQSPDHTTNNTSTTNIQCDSGKGAQSGGCAFQENNAQKTEQNVTTIGSQVITDQSNNVFVKGKNNTVTATNDNHAKSKNTGDTTGTAKQKNIVKGDVEDNEFIVNEAQPQYNNY